MPIEYKRTTNVCDRCGKDISIVGKLEEFEEQQLCSNCYKTTENEKNLKCPECKKVVGIDNMTEYKTESMCYECKDNVKKKEEKTKERKKFLKTNWFKWIMIGFATAGFVVSAYFASITP